VQCRVVNLFYSVQLTFSITVLWIREICRSVVSLQTLSGPCRAISEEWQTVIKKKLCEHLKSGSHVSAEITLKDREMTACRTRLKECVKMKKKWQTRHSARRITWQKWPAFRWLPRSVGVTGSQWHKDCCRFEIAVFGERNHTAYSIADRRACDEIIKNGHCISVLVAESTTANN